MLSLILKGDFSSYALPHYNVPLERRENFQENYLPKYVETLRACPKAKENSQGDTFVFNFESDAEALEAMHLCLAQHQKP